MRQLLRRFAVLGSSSVFTQLIAFGTLAIVARKAGPSNLGAYNWGLGIVSFLSLPITAGITAVGTRDIARDPSRAREVTGEVFVLQFLLAGIGYLLLVLLAPVIAPTTSMRRLLPIVALFLFTGTSFEWTLQALGRMRQIAVARVFGQVIFGVLVPILVISGFDGMRRYAWLMIAGLALKHLATTVFMVRSIGMPRLTAHWRPLWRRLRGSSTLGYTTVLLTLYSQFDLLMLGYLSTAYDTGEYAAANRIPGAIVTFVGAAWTSVVFPHTASLANTDKRTLRLHTRSLLTMTAMVSLPLAACTPFVAAPLMALVFGGQFAAAGTAFALLTVGLAAGLILMTLITILLGLGGDRRYAYAVTVAAAVNITLNLAVIPLFGRNGAAIDTVISDALLFVITARAAREALGGLSLEWWRIRRSVLALIPTIAALLIVSESVAPVWVRIPLAVAVYGAAIVLLRAVAPSEIRHVLAPDLPEAGPASAPAKATRQRASSGRSARTEGVSPARAEGVSRAGRADPAVRRGRDRVARPSRSRPGPRNWDAR
jgi:O-antigen/teichoic acid export membrane protein